MNQSGTVRRSASPLKTPTRSSGNFLPSAPETVYDARAARHSDPATQSVILQIERNSPHLPRLDLTPDGRASRGAVHPMNPRSGFRNTAQRVDGGGALGSAAATYQVPEGRRKIRCSAAPSNRYPLVAKNSRPLASGIVHTIKGLWKRAVGRAFLSSKVFPETKGDAPPGRLYHQADVPCPTVGANLRVRPCLGRADT